MTEPLNPYATVEPWFESAPSWIYADADKNRYLAYRTYEKIYRNYPETFLLTKRGEDNDHDIYLPSGRKIVEAVNRFLAVDFSFAVNPKYGSKSQQDSLNLALNEMFKREKMRSKFTANKRWGLVRGDALMHITADPTKKQGTRISIHELHPGDYFPIVDPENVDRIIGCHIVQLYPDPRDDKKNVVRRQTYRKTSQGITSELALFEIDKWDDRNLEPNEIQYVNWQDTVKEFLLPREIVSIPVYHVRNDGASGDPFGSSLMVGIESLISAMNQSITDEDYTLVMQGLGFYTTDAGPPIDVDTGEEVAWDIGPGRVAEVSSGENFSRVSGVSSVAPMQDHIKAMSDWAQQGAGVPDIAVGQVDVAVAESGIALRLKMGPILSANAEREVEIISTYDQMMYDLANQWYPAYEGFNDGIGCQIDCVVGDPMPENRADTIAEIQQLVGAKLITMQMAMDRLAKLGWEYPEGALETIIEEQKELSAAANADPFAERIDRETRNANDPNKNNGVPVDTGALQ